MREPQKSFGQQETFATDVTDEEYVGATLRRMADNLFAKVREEGRSIRTLTVKVRYNDMGEDQVGESLLEPTDLETDVYGRLHNMLRAAWKRRVSLRLVSLKLANVYDGRFRSELALETSAQRQHAQSRLAVVIDELRRSRGHSVILRGHDFRLRTPPTDTAASLARQDSIAQRRIMMPTRREVTSYVPLRVHSHYSFLDSVLSPKSIVELAKRNGLTAVALTDTGNLHGTVEFVQAAKQHGVKPILGTELRIGDKPLLLYVESARGYHNLCRLLSHHAERTATGADEASVANQQRRSFRREEFSGLTDGLIAVSDDPHVAELFPQSFYQLAVSRDTSGNLPIVACPAIHYGGPNDRRKYDIVQSIRTLTLLQHQHPEKRSGGRLHFRSPVEMMTACREHPDWLRHTHEIAERCNFELPFGKPQFPAYVPADGSPPSEFLRRLVLQGLRDRYGAQAEKYQAQAVEELGIISDVGYEEYFLIRQIMVFLHSNGVSTSRAVRIYKTYGEDAIEKVQANPYALAKSIHGIGFKTADQIAQKIGIPVDSLIRACAGLSHVLIEATDNGHCALPVELLRDEAGKLLLVDDKIVTEALERTLASKDLVKETISGQELIFLPHLKRAEEIIAGRIRSLSGSPSAFPTIDFEKAVVWCQQKTGKELAPSQRDALKLALSSRALVITGGPGVGKTTLVNAILLILRAKKVRCLLCAPTGRAAKRLSEATSVEAKTIHRLLEVQPATGTFTRNEGNPLDCDLLVVDETSMVDVTIMANLLRALPPKASLLIVGDIDQLPSVGPGMVLRHIIESKVVPVVRLTEVFRQAAHSRIIINAHRINEGQMPEFAAKGGESDFFFIDRDEPEQIAATLVEMVKTRIPAKFRLDPIRDIQVLCPMNRGSLGIRELNVRLQNELNPARADEPSVEKFGWQFRPRDKVIQIENDYDKDVFNGDIGQIVKIDPMEREVVIRFDQREVVYDFGELDEISLAYAITIHKSQGSEFPAVVTPLATQQYLLLQRNLVYTGITRGKKLVVLIGQRKALAVVVRNNKTENRFSGLLARLQRDAGYMHDRT